MKTIVLIFLISIQCILGMEVGGDATFQTARNTFRETFKENPAKELIKIIRGDCSGDITGIPCNGTEIVSELGEHPFEQPSLACRNKIKESCADCYDDVHGSIDAHCAYECIEENEESLEEAGCDEIHDVAHIIDGLHEAEECLIAQHESLSAACALALEKAVDETRADPHDHSGHDHLRQLSEDDEEAVIGDGEASTEEIENVFAQAYEDGLGNGASAIAYGTLTMFCLFVSFF